jgi:hypothetical protein
MSRTRLIPVLAAAWLALGAACSDTLAPTDHGLPSGVYPPATALISIVGFVHATTNLRGPVTLSTDDGQEILLVGTSLSSVARIDSAQVEVRGAWVADGTFAVSDFVVRSVEGVAAMDGVLVARYELTGSDLDATMAIGYDLQLTRGGTIALTDPPADLIAHLGERVWVTGDSDAPPKAFGVIDE